MALGDPLTADAPQLMQILYWGGLGLGTFILGVFGYRRVPKQQPE